MRVSPSLPSPRLQRGKRFCISLFNSSHPLNQFPLQAAQQRSAFASVPSSRPPAVQAARP